ncbi:MAG: MogA/MoaB family molybdenum cofactor biosynthesis protein [Pyrinomonadaceae bacterium]|nr:MogA/MoaB family molybdenum cofactor biosynthesis protein [Blastocatellia bacterium]MCW5958153.1 MogA/MoaB family molybdenum cofactor biosynthesis protein [Pyrinomonadaceae bacterium]
MGEGVKIRAAILTTSDTRKPENDVSGSRLVELLRPADAEIVATVVVSDDIDEIRGALANFVSRDDINLVITTGGTGFGPRDNTPEATRAVIEREAPGIAEAIRHESYMKTPMAMLSRGVAGIANGTLIINLPGSPKAVEECFDVIRPVLQHAIDLVLGQTEHQGK